ncbi:hypothetical protein OZX57_06550 [Bifidobacterium sp. ESL0682]|uniref:hypothetical protein n=1 Tax=Bifidobacterium sp. ESL0682 TaxID=2983212 RepID=UPI0023F74B15|nr:hypothetical protein [Bifidobacterium sp. ESL0682]WEV41646.1 hypothetical protein OZX57_06550 [Bifidobacterium sp. ESL0682]
MVDQIFDKREVCIPGPQGEQGEQGRQGLPGVNAVPADKAVAAYLADPDAASGRIMDGKLDKAVYDADYHITDDDRADAPAREPGVGAMAHPVVHAAQTWGTYRHAAVQSTIAGTDRTVRVLGTDGAGLAKYLNRDSAASYVSNSMDPAMHTIEPASYTSAGFRARTTADVQGLLPGMIVDSGSRSGVNRDWYVGVVSTIDGIDVGLEDGWHLCRNDDGPDVMGTPPSYNPLILSPTTKLYGQNILVDNRAGVNAMTGSEIDMVAMNDTDDSVGLDIVSMGVKQVIDGVHVRSTNASTTFQTAFRSTGRAGAKAIAAHDINSPSAGFGIDNDGTTHGLRQTVTVMDSETIDTNPGVVIFYAQHLTVFKLPSAPRGTVLTLITLNDCVLQPQTTLVRPTGNTDAGVNIRLSRAADFLHTAVSDGTNWYMD